MKLLVFGGNGYVATEVIRQCLKHQGITSLTVLSRKPFTPPADRDTSKLNQVLVNDYDAYSPEVKKEIAGAHGCIWTVAITPSKSKAHSFEETRRICYSCTVAGLEAIVASKPASPFHFVYMSGIAAERDRSKTPPLLPEYLLMRGDTENHVLGFAEKQGEQFKAHIVKPGLIVNKAVAGEGVSGSMFNSSDAPKLGIDELSAVLIECALGRIDQQETLMHDDLKELGRKLIEEQQQATET